MFINIPLQTWLALAMLLVAYSRISQAASSASPATNWVIRTFQSLEKDC